MKLLLEHDTNVNCHDEAENTPLMGAAYSNSLPIVDLLLRYKANPNQSNKHGYTALHHAAWEGHTKVCARLLESQSKPDLRTHDLNTPLALACHGNHFRTLQVLIRLDCNVDNQDKDWDTPLLYCAFNGCDRSVRLLLDHGANPEMKNHEQTTPLWNAVYMKHQKVLEILIHCNVKLNVASRGIDQHAHTEHVNLLYPQPRTPLYVACARGEFNMARILVLAGTDLRLESWYWANEHGDLPQALMANGQMMYWLTMHATNPHTLLRLCRMSIRQALGLGIQTKVQQLEIPTVLKNFLLITTANDL